MAQPVQAVDLTKRFGELTAVDTITLAVEPGETFSLLGPNGAGKSTVMKMISGVSPRTGGDLIVLGLDPNSHGREIRTRLGVVPQEDILDTELSVIENLRIYQRYFGIPWSKTKPAAEQALKFVQLEDRAHSRVGPLSGGMKRRLSIARALVNDPHMVLLDEPTTGLDPQARHLLWERLYRLKEQGVTLLLTTHYMDEAEQLADRLVIMDEGRIVAEGSPASLISAHVTSEVAELRFEHENEAKQHAAESALTDAAKAAGLRVDRLPDRSLVYADDGDQVISWLRDQGVRPSGTYVRRSSLEDVFLTLTGRSLDE